MTTDTISIDLDLEGFNQLPGVRCMADGERVRFMIAGQDSTILIAPANQTLNLFPQRSASHRALRDALQDTQAGAAAIARAADPLPDRQAARAALAQPNAVAQ